MIYEPQRVSATAIGSFQSELGYIQLWNKMSSDFNRQSRNYYQVLALDAIRTIPDDSGGWKSMGNPRQLGSADITLQSHWYNHRIDIGSLIFNANLDIFA